MKCISWNVNGLRAVVKKNFMDVFNELMQIFLFTRNKITSWTN